MKFPVSKITAIFVTFSAEDLVRGQVQCLWRRLLPPFPFLLLEPCRWLADDDPAPPGATAAALGGGAAGYEYDRGTADAGIITGTAAG